MSEIPRLIEPLSHVTGSERYNNPKVPEGGYAEDSQREILNEWFREASVFSNKSEEDREKMHAAYLKSNEGLILKGLGSAVARFTPEPLLNEANLAAIQQTAIHLHNNPDALIDMKLETANPQGGNEGLLPTEIAKVSEWSNPFHPLPDFLSQPNTEKGDGTESAKFRTQVWSARQNASAALASGGVPELPQHLNEIGIPDYSVPEDADEVTIARAKKRTAEFKEKYKDVFAKLDEYSNLKNKQNLSENWQSIKDEFEGSAFDIKLTKGTGDYTSVDIRFKGLDGKPVTVTSEKVQGFSPKILSDLIHGTIRGHEAMINDDTSFTLNPFADKKDLQPSTKSRIESLVGAGEEDWLKATGKGIERSVMGVLGSLIKGTSSFIMDEDDVRLKNEKGGSYLEHGAGFLDLMGEAGIASSKAHDAAMALAESRERELYGGTELERQFGLVGEKKNRYFGDIQQSFETAGTVAGELAAIFIAAGWAKGLSALSRAPNAAKGFGTFGTEVAARAGSGAASKAVSVAGHTLNVASYPARALFGNSVAGYITATTSARSAATHAELADAFRKAGHEDYNERALAYTAIEVPALLAINLLSGKLITENSLAMPAIRNWMSKVFADNIQKQTLKGGIQRFITNAVAATPGDAATETAQGILSSMVQQAAREAVAPNSMMTEVMKGRGEIFDGVPVDLLAGIMSAGLFGQFNKAGRGENGISISDEHKKFIDGMKFKVLDEKGGGKAIQMPPMDKDQTGWIARFASPESANIYRESLIELDDITDALFNVDGKGNLTPKPEATKEEIGEYERLSNKLKSTTDFLYKSQMHETTDEGIYSGDTMEQVLLKARQLSDDLFSGEPKPLNERIDDMTGKLALEKADALNDWSAKRDEIVQSLTTDREIPAKNVKLPLDEAKADIAKRAKEIAHRMSQTEPGPEFAELAREYEKVSSEKVSRTVKGKSKPDAERIADKIISDMRSAETESHMNSSRKMAESLLQGEFGPTGETSPDFIGREMADKFKVVKAQVPSAYGGVKTKFELRLANAADAPAVKPLPNPPAVKSSDIGDGPRPKPSAIAQVDSEPEIPRAKIVRGKKPSAANPKPAPSTYFRGKTSPPQSTDLTPDTETAAPEPAEIGATPNNEGPRSTPSTYFRGKKSPPSPPESPVPSIKSPSPLKARARKRAEKTAKKAVDESQDLTARDIAAKELIDNGSTPEEANEIVDRILGSDDIVNKIVDSEAPERSSPKSFSERVNADIGKESAKNWTQEDFAAAEKYISTGDESALSGLTRIKKAVVLRNADEHRAQESSEDNIIRVDEKGIAEVVTADGKHAYKDTTIPPAQSTDTPKNDTQYSKNSASKGMSKDGVLEILGKLGVGPGGMVEVVNDPDANWDGLIRIENGKAVRIELNAAKLPTEADVNRVLNHEIAEAANADGALDFLVSKLTESERGEIIKTVEDLGYAEDQVTAEVAARAVEKLADAYRDRPWFSRMAAAVEQWASNLGLPMTRRAAERVAAKAISRVHPGTIRMEGRQSNPQFVRHSFAGEKADVPQFMRDSLETAKAMAVAGKTSEEIRALTGWFPGQYDGKMRYEVPDNSARLIQQGIERLRRDDTPLNAILNHPQLFTAYPALAKVRVTLGAGNAYDTATNTITLSRAENLSTLIHEVQHAIQHIEGFARGGTPGLTAWFSSVLRPALLKETGRIFNAGKPPPYSSWLGSGDDSAAMRADYGAFEKEWKSKEFQAKLWNAAQKGAPAAVYERLAGEIEARDVQARQSYTPEQRAATAPYSSENISTEDAIVMFRKSGPQESLAGEKSEDQPTEGKGLSVKDSGRGSQAGSTVLFSEIAEFAVQAARSGWSAAKYVAEAVKKFGEKFIEAIKRAFTATAREASDPDAFIAQPSEAPAPVAATRKTNGIVSKNPILSRLLNQSSAPQMSPNQKALTDSVSAEAARLSRIGLLNESKALGAIDRGFSNLFSELNRIHPSLRTMMVHMEKQGLVRKTGWEKESNDYYVKVKKLSPEKRREFTSLYRSGSLEFKNFLKKNGLEREVANLQGLLELIRNEAKRVGVDIGEIEDYLPTIVKPQDRFKLLAKLRGSEHWDAIQESIKKAESKKGRILDEDERAEVANKVLSQSSSRSKANPSNTKARKISTEDFIAEFAEHYMDPHDAIHAYISKMAEKITLNEFFGRDAQTSKMNSDYDGPIARGTSMGNLVMKLMDSGKISSNDVVKIQDIIQSRIEYRPDPPLLQTMKAGNVYLAMNAPIKALMQLVEIGRVAYEQGYWNTASSIGSGFKAAWNESTGSLQSMGISPGAQIGGPKDQLTLGTDIVWRSSLYRIFDGAAAAINSKAYAKRISKMSDAQLTEHISQFQEVWDRPVSEVMEELRKGDWSSPEASEMVFSELARLRPVVLSSMPRKWLKGGPLTRMAYNLKTFQIHQLDGLRNILFDEIKKSPNAKGVVKGIFNLSHVGFVLTMAGAGISQVKDWMMGRHTDWEDDVLDNFLKLILLSKYQMDSSDDPDTFKRNALNVINMPILDFINNAYNLQNKLRSKDTGETKDSGPKTPLDIFRESKVWPQLPTLGFGQWDYWRNTSVSPEKQVDWLKKSYADEMEPHTDRRRHLVEIGRDKRMARGLEDEKRSLEKLMTIKTKYEQQMLKEYKDGDHYAPRAWAEKIKRVAKDPSSWDSEYWKARAMR